MENRNASVPVLITEVELMNSSPDRVFEYLKKQGEKKGKIETDYIDEHTESNLLSRKDKLITLGLALYCLYLKTLSDIFNKALESDDSVLRLACLSNTTVGRSRYSVDLPQALFRRKEELLVWFENSGLEEIDALFKNYTIDDSFLEDYLKGNEYWESIDDNRRLQSIRSLCNNERMVQNYDGPMDGYAEYSFNSVFFAVWKLTETVPVNKQWGNALGYLLEKVIDNRFELNSLKAAKRWMIKDGEENGEKKQFLNAFEMVRAGLYRGVIKDKYGENETNKVHYENDDVAYRVVAYAQTNINIDDIKTAYEKINY